MKLKFILTALYIIVITNHVNAASICIPSVPSSATFTTLEASAANNRGEFTNGGTCTADNTTRTITCTVAPAIRGEAHCSISGILGTSNWENGGSFCWCRLTEVKASNGYVAPYSGGWTFSGDDGTTNNCAAYCAKYCAAGATKYPGIRKSLFIAPNF